MLGVSTAVAVGFSGAGPRPSSGPRAADESTDEATLDRLRARAQANLGREIADLNNFFLLDVPPGHDAASWMDALNLLDEVELAFPAGLAVEPPSGPIRWPASAERGPALTSDLLFSLRAERTGHGGGRTYTITYSVSDSCGNRAEASAIVVVPHDRGGS